MNTYSRNICYRPNSGYFLTALIDAWHTKLVENPKTSHSCMISQTLLTPDLMVRNGSLPYPAQLRGVIKIPTGFAASLARESLDHPERKTISKAT